MTANTLNTQHIRDFLDYIKAEAFLGVHDRTTTSAPPQRYLDAMEAFMRKHHVSLPVVVTPPTPPLWWRQKIQEAYLRDWAAHRDAMRTLRPLFDLLLAVAEQLPGDETGRLHRAAFPHSTDVEHVSSTPSSAQPGKRP